MSLEAKRALETCEAGVQLMIATARANQAKVDEYNNVTIPRYNVDFEEWKKKRDQRVREQQEWENNVNQRAESKRGDSRQWNNCVATWECDAGRHDDWCRNDFGDGWYHAGKEQNCGACTIWGCSQCHGICKKDDGLRRREAISEIGRRPDNFNETEPRRPSPPEQNMTPNNITCCANVTQVVASNINDSLIKQMNDCKSSLNDKYQVEKEKEARQKEKEILRNNQYRLLGIAIIIVCFILFISICLSSLIR